MLVMTISMKHKLSNYIISLCLVGSLLLALQLSAVGQATPPRVASDKQTAKIKAVVGKIGIRGDLTIGLANGRTYHGFVTRIDDELFEMTDVDLKASVTIRYDEVKNIESGYGEKGPLGNRVGKKKRRLGMLIGLAVALIVPVVIVATVKDK